MEEGKKLFARVVIDGYVRKVWPLLMFLFWFEFYFWLISFGSWILESVWTVMMVLLIYGYSRWVAVMMYLDDELTSNKVRLWLGLQPWDMGYKAYRRKMKRVRRADAVVSILIAAVILLFGKYVLLL